MFFLALQKTIEKVAQKTILLKLKNYTLVTIANTLVTNMYPIVQSIVNLVREGKSNTILRGFTEWSFNFK